MRLTPGKCFARKSRARPEVITSTSCPAWTRCASTTRERVACPIPSPTTPYRMRIPVQCNGRRFVWAEDLPPSELCDPAVLDLLQRRGVGLVTSVRPGVRPDLGCLLRRCRERDVDVCLWPMLGNADGRWFSAVNADVFAAFCDELLSELDRDGHRVLGMAFDLEPPIATV